jgi:hypothetical protein
MISMKKIILMPFAIMLFFPVLLFSQDCTDYHQYHCEYADYSFFYSRQSKSTLFKPGQSSEIKIITYSGEDYYIAVCAHNKFGKIHIRLLEDNENQNVFYDNAKDNYVDNITFSSNVTRNMIVEVSVPEGDPKNANDRRCVGVVIEFRKTNPE